jgi:hypothetical protein
LGGKVKGDARAARGLSGLKSYVMLPVALTPSAFTPPESMIPGRFTSPLTARPGPARPPVGWLMDDSDDDLQFQGSIARAERDRKLLAEAIDVEDEAFARRRRKQPVRFEPSASAPKKTKTVHETVPAQKAPEPTIEEDGVAIAGASDHRPSRRQKHVRVKHEDAEEGLIRCPSCGSGVAASMRGCSLTTCRAAAHAPGYFYFCFHCRRSLGNGLPCPDCPERNDSRTRAAVKAEKNEHNRTFEGRTCCAVSAAYVPAHDPVGRPGPNYARLFRRGGRITAQPASPLGGTRRSNKRRGGGERRSSGDHCDRQRRRDGSRWEW